MTKSTHSGRGEELFLKIEGKGGRWEGEKHQCVVASRTPCTGDLTWPATHACALTGNWTGDPLICRLELNSLSHTSQGRGEEFSMPLDNTKLKLYDDQLQNWKKRKQTYAFCLNFKIIFCYILVTIQYKIFTKMNNKFEIFFCVCFWNYLGRAVLTTVKNKKFLM